MKKIGFAALLLLSMLLQACSNDETDDEVSVKPADTTKLVIPIDHDDAQFAMQAADKGLAEIEMGKLAIKKGTDKRVKNFGAMMIRDHTKAAGKLEAIAKIKKIPLPIKVDTNEQKMIDGLTRNYGRDFDKAYLNDIIQEHQNNIKLYQTASKHLMDPDLRGYAAKNLLTFKRHLDAVNMIKGSMR